MYRTTEDTQRRKDATKQSLLDAAAKVFAQKGYHSTKVKDIVDGASVSVGTFYFYFKSKEELYLELYESIVKEFSDITLGVVDTERFTLLKNYTRVMIATLWMYEQKREIARIMLLEVTAASPGFKKLESERMRGFAQTMEKWFRLFKLHDGVSIPDERVAALVYAGSYCCLINEWISSDANTSLVDYGYAFCVYHLQALKISFDEREVKRYITEALKELNASRDGSH